MGRLRAQLLKSLRVRLDRCSLGDGPFLRVTVPGGAHVPQRSARFGRHLATDMNAEFRRFFGRDVYGMKNGTWTYPPDPSCSRSATGRDSSSFYSFRVDVTVEKKAGKYRLLSVRPVIRGSESHRWPPFSGFPPPSSRPAPSRSAHSSSSVAQDVDDRRRRQIRAQTERFHNILREMERLEERIKAERAEKARTARDRGDSVPDGDGEGRQSR